MDLASVPRLPFAYWAAGGPGEVMWLGVRLGS
jgi:hypothetical protein